VSRRLVGIVLLLVLSLCLGVLVSERFFHLYLKTIPPMSLSAWSASNAHAAFLSYGFILGIVLWVWGLLAALLSRFFRNTRTGETAGRRPGAAQG
jgi:hypothetical protein